MNNDIFCIEFTAHLLIIGELFHVYEYVQMLTITLSITSILVYKNEYEHSNYYNGAINIRNMI